MGRSTAYLWRREDPEFAAKWDDAVADGIDLLEDEARRRALEGSDKLLMFLLERRRPEVWARSKTNRPEGFARSHDAGRKFETKVPSLEEARSRMKAVGLLILEIEGDYEELDAPRERSQSSVSASVGEDREQRDAGRPRYCAGNGCEIAAGSQRCPANSHDDCWRKVRRLPFRRSRKNNGRSSA